MTQLGCVSMFIPAQFRDVINTIGEGLNFGPNNFMIPLSPTGGLPITHYGTQSWEVPGSGFNVLRVAVETDALPDNLKQYANVFAALAIYPAENSTETRKNWQEALDAMGLKLVGHKE